MRRIEDWYAVQQNEILICFPTAHVEAGGVIVLGDRPGEQLYHPDNVRLQHGRCALDLFGIESDRTGLCSLFKPTACGSGSFSRYGLKTDGLRGQVRNEGVLVGGQRECVVNQSKTLKRDDGGQSRNVPEHEKTRFVADSNDVPPDNTRGYAAEWRAILCGEDSSADGMQRLPACRRNCTHDESDRTKETEGESLRVHRRCEAD